MLHHGDPTEVDPLRYFASGSLVEIKLAFRSYGAARRSNQLLGDARDIDALLICQDGCRGSKFRNNVRPSARGA